MAYCLKPRSPENLYPVGKTSRCTIKLKKRHEDPYEFALIVHIQSIQVSRNLFLAPPQAWIHFRNILKILPFRNIPEISGIPMNTQIKAVLKERKNSKALFFRNISKSPFLKQERNISKKYSQGIFQKCFCYISCPQGLDKIM